MMRPDGAVLAAIALSAAGVAWLVSRHPALLRALLQSAAMLAACVVLLIAWRLWYHGDWVPNTVRVKGEMNAITLERGWNYVVSLLLYFPGLLAVLALAWLAPRGVGLERSLPLLCALGAYLAYPVAVGGDFMPMDAS